jgi:hypothetical protein
MKNYWSLVQGVGIGIAGLVICILGWVDDSLKWILLTLSPIVIIASVAPYFFNIAATKSADTAQ